MEKSAARERVPDSTDDERASDLTERVTSDRKEEVMQMPDSLSGTDRPSEDESTADTSRAEDGHPEDAQTRNVTPELCPPCTEEGDRSHHRTGQRSPARESLSIQQHGADQTGLVHREDESEEDDEESEELRDVALFVGEVNKGVTVN